MAAPLQRTATPGVYARGSRWVAVYLENGRQRRRSAPTFREAREIRVRATAQEAARRAGPTLHSYALEWVDQYAGRGANDVINDRTRRAADLDAERPRIHVRRAMVDGQLTGPKSRHGRRTIPISHELADRLAVRTVDREETELLFVGAQGATLRPGNLRYRVMIPAAERAGVPWARFHTLRHTCAALLIDAGASPLRLQHWMGHHSASFTLDNYGHLIDDSLGPHLSLPAT